MKIASELHQEHCDAISHAQCMGFVFMDRESVLEYLGTASAMMQEVGYNISHVASRWEPSVAVAVGDEAIDFLKHKGANGIYGFGVVLVTAERNREVIVHELVHHLQGLWADDLPKNRDVPYHERWQEVQAHHIGFAVRMRRSPSSWLVKLRLRIAGIKLPTC